MERQDPCRHAVSQIERRLHVQGGLEPQTALYSRQQTHLYDTPRPEPTVTIVHGPMWMDSQQCWQPDTPRWHS
jgi:hypothetical protein